MLIAPPVKTAADQTARLVPDQIETSGSYEAEEPARM
jgi:hypothetical protein